MGCPLSKTNNDNDGPNSSQPKCTAPNEVNGESLANKQVDPRLPLNVRQKFNLSKSWKGISREMEMTGVLMFVKYVFPCIDPFTFEILSNSIWLFFSSPLRLFEENIDIMHLFAKFQELKTKDSQLTSMELAEHATKVMSNFDEMINALDDMDYFFHHLHSIGKLHRKIPGFKGEYFYVSTINLKIENKVQLFMKVFIYLDHLCCGFIRLSRAHNRTSIESYNP